jgi:hypothetical protein
MKETKNNAGRGLMLRTIILGVFLMMMVLGCAAPQIPPSGFLSDYPRLKVEPTEEGVSWWELPGVPWQKYKRLMIDPVQIRINTAKAEREMKGAELEKLAKALHSAVVEAMKDRYPIAKASAPDVLRIHAALTHLKPVNPAVNIATTVLLFMPVDVGESAVEVQFIDSTSGRILSELMASQRGSYLDIIDVWTRWSQVEEGFKLWARKLRGAMDEVHGESK